MSINFQFSRSSCRESRTSLLSSWKGEGGGGRNFVSQLLAEALVPSRQSQVCYLGENSTVTVLKSN